MVLEIVDVCCEIGIEIKGNVFTTSPSRLRENAKYIKENFGDEFVQRLIVCHNPSNLRQVLPFLDECGYLSGLLTGSSSILNFNVLEIEERIEVLRCIGEDVLLPNGKYNPIFSQSRTVYNDRYQSVISGIRSKKSKVKK